MAEAKDPAIKLFGKTIPVPEVAGNDSPSGASLGGGGGGGGGGEDGVDQNRRTNSSPDKDCAGTGEEVREVDKDTAGGKVTDSRQEDVPQPSTSDEFADPDANSGANENPKTPSVDKENATLKHSLKTEEEQSETSISQEKTLKKPDKIIPCPRCNSMDTKFCYYNNYNVNQPRHFCKNCQRYWTAGGTMRNVPVGAGRRKNKNSASHYRHITVSDALQSARTDVPNGVHHHPALKTNGTVLTFGSDAPLCDSMASVLNIAEKTMRNCSANGFHKPEKLRIPVLPYGGGENGDDHLSKSSAMVSNSKEEAGKTALPEQVMPNCHGFPPQISCFPRAPFPYPWNSAQWSPPVPAVPPVPPPAFCPSGFPMPFYPAAAYWGCTVPGAWNIPWLPQPSTLNHATPSSGPNSPTLGKHSRDENMLKASNSWEEEEPLKENNSERCLWIPKTLRIDDPGEAARSSIWATLGIKNDKADPVSSGRLFKPFQSKAEVKNHIAETSPVLQANPAALSRSLNFHENS